MKITDEAVKIILQIMLKKNLNPLNTFLEFSANDDGMTISFSQDRHGEVHQFGALSVIVASNIDTTGVVIDFGEVKGRQGLIFLGEEKCQNK